MIKLSYSAASKYLLSPMSYYLHYFLRLRPVDEGSALAFGAGMDSALNLLLEHKRDPLILNKIDAVGSDVVYSPEQVVTRAKQEFDKEFGKYNPRQIKYTKADADETSLPDWFLLATSEDPSLPLAYYCLKHKAYILIEEYADQVIPRIQEVYEIQRDISLKNELGDEFTGKIDFICKWEDGRTWIVDNKTSSVTYAADAVSKSEQLATYYEAMRDKYDLAGALYIVIPKKVRKVKLPRVEIKFVFGQIGEEIIAKTFNDYDQALDGIKNARFTCSGNCCKTPWGCPYMRYCNSNGSDLTGLKVVEARK